MREKDGNQIKNNIPLKWFTSLCIFDVDLEKKKKRVKIIKSRRKIGKNIPVYSVHSLVLFVRIGVVLSRPDREWEGEGWARLLQLWPSRRLRLGVHAALYQGIAGINEITFITVYRWIHSKLHFMIQWFGFALLCPLLYIRI